VQQIIGEPGMCTSQCTGKVCGNDGCGGSCGTCNTGFSCDVLGQCYSNTCTPAADPTLLGVCGNFACGTAVNGTCGSVSCGTCETGFACNATQQCAANCGNGVIDVGEGCDDGNKVSSDGCSSLCVVETGYTCTGAPSKCTYGGGGSPTSCPSYCLSLGYHGIPEGSCRQNANTCINFGETCTPPIPGEVGCGGSQWCTGGAQADTCCCKP
ncbi:MAG: DUF4215 domain-containing protein, partial [Nanoarchaeota archaeon]